jgi:predicted GNAT family acetyltransferase
MSPSHDSELEFRILQPADQEILEAFLLPRIASSMFLLGNSRRAGLVDRGEPLQATYAGAFRDGALVGVAAHCWNGNAILQAATHTAALCQHAVHASGRALVGLLGPDAQVAAVWAALSVQPAQLRLDSVETLFWLQLASLRVPATLASGAVRVRDARAGDFELLAAWRAAYEVEALNEPDTPELRQNVRLDLERSIGKPGLWIAEHDGTPVAMTAFNATTPEVVQIGGVFTPEPLRGRGYARAAVAHSLLQARAGGVQSSLLFTGNDNLPAQRAYRALGYEQVGDYRLSFLKTPLPASPLPTRSGRGSST